MTEDEAKTKACCGPRNSGAQGGDKDLLCIASDCMAWRLVPIERRHVKSERAAEEYQKAGRKVGPQGSLDGPLVALRGGEGYCGLAGAPA